MSRRADQQKINPHGFVVVVVVVRDVVGGLVVVGGFVVVVVGAAVVVVDDSVVVVVADVVVVVPLDDVRAVAAVVVAVVRPGCEAPVTTTMSAPSAGRPEGGSGSSVVPFANRAAITTPIKAPTASRAGPPAAVSIDLDYRPHSTGSNRSRELVPGRYAW
ncbi:hypothetical protein GCM10010492_22980 [Saccharothrix mutabilis subsp. mutabilis]|uniref:Uncharacterized protein n=1 Tax=Saccharothrix mutabilis subsp. mutabilis TaxID=66855 RepID=A0ABP3D7Z4_9PSEU